MAAWYGRFCEVTQIIIDTAMRSSSVKCMVRNAIRETFPDATRIIVDGFSIRLTLRSTGMRYSFQTPVRVQQYIIAFDAGAPITPFSFRLGNPRHVTKVRRKSVKENPLDVTKASQREIKQAIKKGRDIKGKTQVFDNDDGRRPTIVGGAPPRGGDSTMARRYGFRALAARYMNNS